MVGLNHCRCISDRHVIVATVGELCSAPSRSGPAHDSTPQADFGGKASSSRRAQLACYHFGALLERCCFHRFDQLARSWSQIMGMAHRKRWLFCPLYLDRHSEIWRPVTTQLWSLRWPSTSGKSTALPFQECPLSRRHFPKYAAPYPIKFSPPPYGFHADASRGNRLSPIGCVETKLSHYREHGAANSACLPMRISVH